MIGLPGIHVECKRVERLDIYGAIAQAVHDCGSRIPAVFHRKNRCEWLVTLRMDDFMHLYGQTIDGEEGAESDGNKAI